MNGWKTLALSLGLALATTQFSPSARADEWNKETKITFDNPVEVPGRVLLAGSYTFKLADSVSDRQVVEIFDSHDHLVTFVLAVPDYRMDNPSKTVIRFGEGHHNAPETVQEWFYPGDNSGLQFVYPASSGK